MEDFRGTDLGNRRELVTELLADIGHLLEIVRLMDMHPFQHLMGTVLFLSQGKKEFLHLNAGQAQQVDLVGHISSGSLRLAGAGAKLVSGKEVGDFTLS